MSDLLSATDPNACGYVVTVIWPDGTPTTYQGIGMTAEQVAEALERVSAEIVWHLQPAGESETA